MAEVQSANQSLTGQLAAVENELAAANKAVKKSDTEVKKAREAASARSDQADQLATRVKQLEEELEGADVLTARFRQEHIFV